MKGCEAYGAVSPSSPGCGRARSGIAVLLGPNACAGAASAAGERHFRFYLGRTEKIGGRVDLNFVPFIVFPAPPLKIWKSYPLAPQADSHISPPFAFCRAEGAGHGNKGRGPHG